MHVRIDVRNKKRSNNTRLFVLFLLFNVFVFVINYALLRIQYPVYTYRSYQKSLESSVQKNQLGQPQDRLTGIHVPKIELVRNNVSWR